MSFRRQSKEKQEWYPVIVTGGINHDEGELNFWHPKRGFEGTHHAHYPSVEDAMKANPFMWETCSKQLDEGDFYGHWGPEHIVRISYTWVKLPDACPCSRSKHD